MEGDVGAQVAPPIFFHHQQPLTAQLHEAPPFAKKRDFPWQNQSFIQSQRLMGADIPNPGSGNWNPRMWEWDSLNFIAKPSADGAQLASGAGAGAAPVEGQKKRGDASSKSDRNREEDSENLTLKLGGENYTVEPSAAVRPTKRVRSGPLGNGGCYPMCQVDDCRADLSGAKDYHRRHKVCEVHSKTTKALVGNQMQRFCQQCSRFHPLLEFDEGKRSCRRRLAGHNRRRRKTQPEDVPSRLVLPTNQLNSTSGNLDIINLLSVMARLQGNAQGKPTSVPTLPDKDRLLQLLSKINTLNNANASSRSPVAGGFDLNVSQAPQQGSLEQLQKANGSETAPLTINLLAALSSALAASAPDALASLSQGSSGSSGNDKTNVQSVETVTDVNSHNKAAQMFASVGIGQDHCTNQSPAEVSQQPGLRSSLALQLFGSSEDDSPPNVGSAMKYLSSESSNPTEEQSPSSSPPVTQKLFPLHSTAECMKHAHVSNCREDNGTVELSTNLGCTVPLDLFKMSEMRVERAAVQSVPYQAGYTSSSGSDHSPSSSNSDAQDRTGRIIFKLFGKDPSSFPATLRTQILNWLSNSPSEMESYIRPGCVVLSIYVSMPSMAWEEFEEDLLQRVNSLVESSESEFWRNGRFLVRTNRQLVSHKDGKIHLSKSWRAWSSPELTSVSPVAVVGGQKTSFILKGRNLTVPGTKIYCTYMGKYTSKEVLFSAYPGTIYDDSSMEKFQFPAGFPKAFGRCFVEVENGFKGNSFPVIVADANICRELRVLESYFEEDVQAADGISEDQAHNSAQPQSREDVLHFLNELGWLFQKMHTSSSSPCRDFSSTRFKYLIAFSVEQDWCALIKTLLDMLMDRGSTSDALIQESLEMLSELHLLSRAVKRKCRKMVELLLNYSVKLGNSVEVYLFPPNMAGPGRITPLHLAACALDSEDIVDALTNDPQEIGLKSWSSLRDDSDQSPYTFAVLRNNYSYNKLVARKLADRSNGQVTISIGNDKISVDKPWAGGELDRHSLQARSCAQCVLAGSMRQRLSGRSKGLLQRPYVHSMLAIAAVCVCVCILYRAFPRLRGHAEPFKWETIEFGPI